MTSELGARVTDVVGKTAVDAEPLVSARAAPREALPVTTPASHRDRRLIGTPDSLTPRADVHSVHHCFQADDVRAPAIGDASTALARWGTGGLVRGMCPSFKYRTGFLPDDEREMRVR